ncbi:MAG: trigger factor [Casimicrobiaceae bacterium]
MQTNLESTGQLERRLDVALPLAEIDTEVEKRLARLARTVKVAGFRPGKVPLKMVVQQYGRQVRSDVISDRVQESLSDAIRSQNLRVAGYPRIEPAAAAPSDGEIAFSAVFEVYPDIKVGDISTAEIERPVAEVTSTDVDVTIEVLRKQRVTFNPVDRAAADGDQVVVDFSGTIDGVEFGGGQAKDFPIVLGEGRMLPEFETALRGMRAGEEKTFDLTFPADYHGQEVAGKPARFALQAKSVAEPVLPSIDEAFVKSFGIESGQIDDLKSEVTANLKVELRRKIESRLKEQALAALRQSAQFAVPKVLVEQESENMARQMTANLQQQGMKAADIKLSPDMFRTNAEERVALGLILAELVREHDLQAKPDQVKALVQETAQTFEHPEAVVRWHYEQPERLNEFEALAVERNVIDWVLARARVHDKKASFRELMGPART